MTPAPYSRDDANHDAAGILSQTINYGGVPTPRGLVIADLQRIAKQRGLDPAVVDRWMQGYDETIRSPDETIRSPSDAELEEAQERAAWAHIARAHDDALAELAPDHPSRSFFTESRDECRAAADLDALGEGEAS